MVDLLTVARFYCSCLAMLNWQAPLKPKQLVPIVTAAGPTSARVVGGTDAETRGGTAEQTMCCEAPEAETRAWDDGEDSGAAPEAVVHDKSDVAVEGLFDKLQIQRARQLLKKATSSTKAAFDQNIEDKSAPIALVALEG